MTNYFIIKILESSIISVSIMQNFVNLLLNLLIKNSKITLREILPHLQYEEGVIGYSVTRYNSTAYTWEVFIAPDNVDNWWLKDQVTQIKITKPSCFMVKYKAFLEIKLG